MKIGMMYAMDGEIESLLKNENAHLIEKVSGASFYQIRENVVACAGGVGKVNAAMSTQLLLSRYAPDVVLNVGVAGCFENVPIGTLVLATGFVQHDSDTSALGDPVGLVSTVNKVEFPTAWPEKPGPPWIRRACPIVRGWWPPATGLPPTPPAATGSTTPSTPCCARWRGAPWPRCATETACRFSP